MNLAQQKKIDARVIKTEAQRMQELFNSQRFNYGFRSNGKSRTKKSNRLAFGKKARLKRKVK